MTIKRSFRIVLSAAIAWPLLAWLAAQALVVSPAPMRADAMLVLAGSSTFKERTHRAAQLFKDGSAPKIILTNDNQESGWSDELQTNPLFVQRAVSELRTFGVPEEQIEIVPDAVSSTREEAARVREYATSSGLRSILVVTSAYQVRRARWTFDRIFAGSGVNVSFASVPPGDQTPRPLTWWLQRRGWDMVAGEYVKLAYYIVKGVNFTETSQAAPLEYAEPQDRSGLKTDRSVYRTPPLPTRPRAGGKFIDPVFGTEIMRATDEVDGPAPGLGTYYSHWPTFNANSTRLLIRKGHTGDAILKTFDPSNFKLGAGREVLPLEYPGGFGLSWESSTWSHSDPDVVHTFANDRKGGMRLYAYNVVRKEFKLVKDLSSIARGRDYLRQMYVSANDDVFGWLLARVGVDEPLGYIVYKRSTNSILYNNPASAYVGGINEVHVDKSGRWLTIHLNQTQPDNSATRILNLQTGKIDFLYKNASDSPAGHGDLGTETVVGFDAWMDGITWRRLSTPHSPRRVFYFRTAVGPQGGVADWTHDFHGTMMADNEDWITIGTHRDPSATQRGSGIYDDEILQVSLDGSERIRRICHTRSVYDAKTDTTGYWSAPKPTISRDGRFIAFTSNWGKSGRYDLFIAKIDPAPYLTKAGPPTTPPVQRPRRAQSP
ncbi:MAG TPA: YdcF family protein [Pyrinomonadaceae bacterium]|nr:YdcF family protein [Pyrinomonadaceae bacterium]